MDLCTTNPACFNQLDIMVMRVNLPDIYAIKAESEGEKYKLNQKMLVRAAQHSPNLLFLQYPVVQYAHWEWPSHILIANLSNFIACCILL